MRLIEERPAKIPSDVLQSMSRVNVEKHDELSAQMAAWERKNEVTIVPMGVVTDSLYRPGSDSTKKGGNVSSKQTTATKKSSVSGHQNLIKRSNDTYLVLVGTVNLGVHDKISALKIRDKYRVENDLPAAEY